MYENRTDVSGFLMASRIVRNPKSIERITYRELHELTYMGASVLHEETIFPVWEAGIPVNVKNTNAPDDPGTLIITDKEARHRMGNIPGIAGKKDFTVPTNEIKRERNPDAVEVSPSMALFSTVGLEMAYTPGVAAKFFTALSKANINIRMIDQGSSEINIIIGVENQDFEKAVCAPTGFPKSIRQSLKRFQRCPTFFLRFPVCPGVPEFFPAMPALIQLYPF